MITVNKAETAALVLAKIAEGTLSGGAYIRQEEFHANQGREAGRPECKVGNRCAIGWLLPEAMAIHLEGLGDYRMARGLINSEELVTDDDAWFIRLQDLTDLSLHRNFSEVAAHCRAALPSHGYDIGNRRSDPVYK